MAQLDAPKSRSPSPSSSWGSLGVRPEPAPVQLAQRTAAPDPETGLAGRARDWPSSVDFRSFTEMRPDGEVAPKAAVVTDGLYGLEVAEFDP
jgi:hypothetical protein